ncbi:NAD-dependent epimerase/dehydratase family protein [Vibrio sonorensis]|uniref:NAD-dependent epimerase/dehydratase family protein n=1 Tax=Vibrio sonorensis TaxID=1004316 RepID=UPI0008DA2053|nr:NAD-dependent epimerase/dehydratase family protein [Vibrio sonorensis]
MSKHVVLGGFGHVGSHIVKKLTERGCEVISVSRSPHNARYPLEQTITGDITEEGFLSNLVNNQDKVYLCCAPSYQNWDTDFLPMIERISQELSDKHIVLVYADNLYMYGPQTGTFCENTSPSTLGPKGQIRFEAYHSLVEKKGNWNIVTCRAADFYGPGVHQALMGELVFKSALEGKSAIYLGSLSSVHSFTYIEDFAQAMITLAEDKRAYGGIWHVPMRCQSVLKPSLTKYLNKWVLNQKSKTYQVGKRQH